MNQPRTHRRAGTALSLAAVIVATALLAGCIEWFPGRVSKGVARLTVRNAGAILVAIEEDDRCGFSSNIEPVIEGELGTLGSATWTVTGCELQFADALFDTDCAGETQHLDGRIVVSATKTIHGWVSGDPNEPIVPQTEDAARIEFSAVLDEFKVTTSAGPEKLRMKSGTLNVVAVPRLAQLDDLGACAAATPNVLFEQIRYEDADLHVTSEDRTFDVSVPTGSLGAQAGIGRNGRENALWGKITVWDSSQSVDDLELDPDYDTQEYRDSYLCKENYTLPLSHSCGMEGVLGQGVARLLVHAFGYSYLAVEADEACGFGGFIGMIPDDIEGVPFVDPEVKATWRTYGCEVAPVEPRQVARDCLGLDVFMQGSATIDASKVIVGAPDSGNPPILPQTRREASIEVSRMEVSNLEMWEEGPGALEPTLSLESGTLSGTLYPITGESARQPGAYTVVTPVVEFSQLKVEDAAITLRTEGKTFRFHIKEASIDAFRGAFDEAANEISGIIMVDGTHVLVSGELVPEYSQEEFDSTYVCTEDLLEVIPPHGD